ncbi:MAG: methyltransferase domain-containing protein [Chloroflexi bacterium]|nr:methyltransferase domain-containing protein [Chloroflexota bacterium]
MSLYKSFTNIRKWAGVATDYLFHTPALRLQQMDYDAYWQTRGPHEVQPRVRLMARFIEQGSSVYDVGCGDGTALAYLRQSRNIEAHGCDLSEVAAQMAQEKGLHVQVCDVTAPDFRFDGTFDYIVISEVLEHIPDPEALLQKARGHFRRGLIVTIPNIGHIKHRARLLLGRFPVQWVYHPGEHLRFWTVLDFLRWAAELDYHAAAVHPSNGSPWLYKRWPNLFANQVIFVLKNEN